MAVKLARQLMEKEEDVEEDNCDLDSASTQVFAAEESIVDENDAMSANGKKESSATADVMADPSRMDESETDMKD